MISRISYLFILPKILFLNYYSFYNMDRRDFLKWIWWLWLWLLLPDLTKASEVDNSTKSGIDTTEVKVKVKVKDVLEIKDSEKYEKSISSVWKKEVDFFTTFFSISDNTDDFINKIKSLQKEFGFPIKSQDWVLWPATLKQIYLEYYSKNQDKLDEITKKRLFIYNEMLWYSKHPKALYRNLNVFSKNTYYGKDVWLNKEWTLINENLFWKVPDSIDKKINKIIVSKIDGKNVLSFYVDGKLYIATYVSPGLLDHQTSMLKTIWKNYPDKYHYSSEYPEINIEKKIFKKWWAVMPYAVHVDWSVWLHWSDWPINGNPESHGCVRTPLFYMKELHEKVIELWINNVLIDTTRIYS